MEDAEGGGNDDKVIDRTTRSEGEAVIDIRDSGKSKDEWLAGFAEASDRWFWEMDENLRFTWISKNLELYLNGPREWHYGKTRGEIGAPDVPSEIWADHLETLRQHRPFKDFIYRRSGPSDEKWLTTSGVPMFDAKGKFQGYRGTGGDVTALMRAKEEASRNAALVEQAVDGMSELFLLCDENDKIVLYNQTFKEVNAAIIDRVSPGMRFEDFVRLIISAGMVPEAIGREEEYFEERMSYHRNAGGAFVTRREGNRWLLVRDERTKNGGTVVISAEITEQAEAEAQLRDAIGQVQFANRAKTEFLANMSHELRTVVSRSWWKFAGGALRAGDCWPCQAARSRVAGWIG